MKREEDWQDAEWDFWDIAALVIVVAGLMSIAVGCLLAITHP